MFLFVFTLCLALMCVPLLASAQDAARQQVRLEAKKTLQQLKIASETAVRTRWHADRGTVRSLYNLTIPAPAGTPEASARQFLNTYRELFAMMDQNIDLRLKKVQRSLTAEHVRLHQYYNGIEVYGAELSVHIDRLGQVRVVHNNYFPRIKVNTVASLSPGEATNIAAADIGVRRLRKPSWASLVIFPNRDALQRGDYAAAYQLAYRAIIPSLQPLGDWEYIIDANTGQTLYRRNLLQFAEGHGRVFNPNPVVALQDATLEDRNDSNDAIPETAYEEVTLPGLDGSGFLDGTYASTRLTQNRAFDPNLEFNYLRRDNRFEEVMSYYHIDSVARYLSNLGFDFLFDEGWQIPVAAHVDNSRNAFYSSLDTSVHFGDGNADAGEDGEIIVHEYGHAILDQQVNGFGQGLEAGAIDEAFSDFLAASFYLPVSRGFGDTTIAEWGIGGLNRPVNGTKHYPEDIFWKVDADGTIHYGEPHADGEIYSACLWQLLEGMGRDESLTLVIESQYFLSPDAQFLDGALAILVTDYLLNDFANIRLIDQVFEARGIFAEPTFEPDIFENNDTFGTAKAVKLPFWWRGLSIDSAYDDDYYAFELKNRAYVHITITYPFTHGFDFPKLSLLLLDGKLNIDGSANILYDSLSDKGIIPTLSKSTFTTGPRQLNAGKYVVVVLDDADEGSETEYELTIMTDLDGADFKTATEIKIGQGFSRFIDFPGDRDVFKFQAQKGQLLDLQLERLYQDAKTDTFLLLYDQQYKFLMKSDDVISPNSRSDPRSSSRILGFTPPSDGVYFAVISNVDGTVGGFQYNYRFSVFKDDHPESLTGRETPLAFDKPVSGVINYLSDDDGFRFEANTGQVIDLHVDAYSIGSQFDATLSLLNPNGETIAQFRNDTKQFIDPSIRFRIPAGGVYYVDVGVSWLSRRARENEEFRRYLLTLTAILDDHAEFGSGEETKLVFDDAVTGAISFAGDTDAFRFWGTQGQVIALEVMAERAGSPLDAVLKLLDADGATLVSVDDFADTTDPILPGYALPEDGDYFVQISAYEGGGSDFTYTLTLSKGKLPDDDYSDKTATEIVVDQPIEGVINYPNDIDLFAFNAREGDIVTIDIDAYALGSPLDPVLFLYDPAVKLLKFSDNFDDTPDSLIQNIRLPDTGTYYIFVLDATANGGAEYNYTLKLTKGSGGDGLVYPQWDVNQDGVVNIFDLVLVNQHLGENYIKASPIAKFGQPRSASAEGEVRVVMTPRATASRQVTVSIHTTAIRELYGYQLSINYNPTVLELLSTSPSQALTGDLPQSYWNVSQQGPQLELTQVRQGSSEGRDVEGSLVTLVFRVKQGQHLQPQLPIKLVKVQFADSMASSIPIDVVNEPTSLADLFPAKPMLLQNYPNPFNPETWIPYQISLDSEVVISIYDAKGRLVRQLELGYQPVGTYISSDKAAYWDGHNQLGEPVTSGIYFYTIKAGDFTMTRKMLMVK